MGQSAESCKTLNPPAQKNSGGFRSAGPRPAPRGVSAGSGLRYSKGMLVVVGLIVAFILIAVFSNRATRQCRWRERRSGETSQWTCIQCGASVEGKPGEPPRTCLRS